MSSPKIKSSKGIVTLLKVPSYCEWKHCGSWSGWLFFLNRVPHQTIYKWIITVFFIRIAGWEFSIDKWNVQGNKDEYFGPGHFRVTTDEQWQADRDAFASFFARDAAVHAREEALCRFSLK